MDFDFNEDQRLLKDSVDRMLGRPGGATWTDFVDAGLTALPLPAAVGGFGGGGVELMIVMDAIGRTLDRNPFVSSVVLAGLTACAAGGPRSGPLIQALIDGSGRSALAFGEPQSRYRIEDVETRATRSRFGWSLSGVKTAVLQADEEGHLLILARTSGEDRAADGLTLFVVPAHSPGLTRRARRTADDRALADITLRDLALPADAMVGPEGEAWPIIRRAVDWAIAAGCAEAVGAMQVLHEMTVDHLKTRRQFGVPIGSFQALQHRAADMLVAIEQSRSMTYYAASLLEAAAPGVRTSGVAAAKVQVNEAARFVGQQAIQLHGGIGMTEEYGAGAYFKRLTVLENLFGDTDHHLDQIDAWGGVGVETPFFLEAEKAFP